MTDIIRHAAVLSGTTVQAIVGKRRHQQIARIRFAVCLVGMECGRSQLQIGKHLGGRDHSTVCNGIARATYTESREPEYAAFLNQLRLAVAETEPFERLELPEPPPPPPVVVPHVKRVVAAPDEDKDSAHLFHDKIAEGTCLLTAALDRMLAERAMAA